MPATEPDRACGRQRCGRRRRTALSDAPSQGGVSRLIRLRVTLPPCPPTLPISGCAQYGAHRGTSGHIGAGIQRVLGEGLQTIALETAPASHLSHARNSAVMGRAMMPQRVSRPDTRDTGFAQGGVERPMTERARRTRRGLSPSRAAGCQWLEPLPVCRRSGSLVATAGAGLGRSALDRVHRPSPCRQHGAAGAAPSQKAVPVGLAPVPPRALARRSRAPAGLQPKRSVRVLDASAWT